MPGRRLSPDERALWRKVVSDVTPLRAVDNPQPQSVRAELVEALSFSSPARKKEGQPFDKLKANGGSGVASPPPPPAKPADTLDASWDRRLRRGAVVPDRVIDLHGHTLAAAHATLDAALDAAVGAGDRVLLVVAGRFRPEGARGAIRRSVGDWLAASRHAARIAAVRAAHPRHGGGGAFYLILRR